LVSPATCSSADRRPQHWRQTRSVEVCAPRRRTRLGVQPALSQALTVAFELLSRFESRGYVKLARERITVRGARTLAALAVRL
jgi:hypothetical protein